MQQVDIKSDYPYDLLKQVSLKRKRGTCRHCKMRRMLDANKTCSDCVFFGQINTFVTIGYVLVKLFMNSQYGKGAQKTPLPQGGFISKGARKGMEEFTTLLDQMKESHHDPFETAMDRAGHIDGLAK
jgi:hypothetical protein